MSITVKKSPTRISVSYGSTSTQSGTSYTVVQADSGSLIQTTSSSAVTITLPANLIVGTQIMVAQMGTGQVTFSAASGATIVNRLSLTKTSGQYAAVSLIVTANVGGNAAQYLLMGDVGA